MVKVKKYDEESVKKKFEVLIPLLDEKTRRLVLGAEARAIGYGGISLVSRATGVSRNTISRGVKELNSPDTIEKDRIRKPGAGRKRLVEIDTTLKSDLNKLIDRTCHQRRSRITTTLDNKKYPQLGKGPETKWA